MHHQLITNPVPCTNHILKVRVKTCVKFFTQPGINGQAIMQVFKTGKQGIFIFTDAASIISGISPDNIIGYAACKEGIAANTLAFLLYVF